MVARVGEPAAVVAQAAYLAPQTEAGFVHMSFMKSSMSLHRLLRVEKVSCF